MGLAKIENQAITDQEAAFHTFKALAIEMTTKGLESNHSRLAYDRALGDFFLWYEGQGRPALRLMLLESYRDFLKQSGKGAANINQRLSAIRRMIRRSAANNLIAEPAAALSAANVEGVSRPGRSVGKWLTKGQAEAFLRSLPRETLAEKRDFALIALALSSGLRRSEIASLTLNHIQQVESRWALLGLVGKRNKIRDVPITAWAKAALEDWIGAAGITEGRIFRPINKGGKLSGDRITPEAIRQSVDRAIRRANEAGANVPEIACHDLRRTFAQLARKGGSPIEQISKSLGHSSISTTQIYLGNDQDFTNAPADCLGLNWQ
jgi:integrase